MLAKPVAALLVAATLAANAAGCGGEDGSDASGASITTSSLTRAEFVKQANALCARNREDRFAALDAYLKQRPNASEDERVAGALEEVYIPTMEAQIAELRELGAPRGDARRIEEILLAFERSVAAAGSLEGASSNASVDQRFERAGALAREYGLRECTYG